MNNPVREMNEKIVQKRYIFAAETQKIKLVF